MSDSVTKRFTWEEIETFPGNPLLDTRLNQMADRWGGYIPQVVGIPLVADNTAGAFPEYDPDAIVMVNGHHRQALARRYGHGGDEVICELLRGKSREDLHRIFQQVNDNRTIKHVEKFLHRLGQKEPKALGITGVLEREGYGIALSPGDTGMAVHSTSALEWIWDGGDKRLRKRRGQGPHRGTLTLTIAAYHALTEGKAFTQQSALLKGLGAFFLRYPDADSERLIERLKGHYPAPTAERALSAAKHAKADFGLSNNYEAFGFIARIAYNGRANSKQNLPEWRS